MVAGVCSLVTARQFGAGVLEDSFASRLSTYYRTSAQFMALYGLLNFYLYTMAYVYAPALQQVYGQREYLETIITLHAFNLRYKIYLLTALNFKILRNKMKILTRRFYDVQSISTKSL